MEAIVEAINDLTYTVGWAGGAIFLAIILNWATR